MSIVAHIAHVADIDTRLAMFKAGLDVPPRRVTIPNITLIPWTSFSGAWFQRLIGQFRMTWYPLHGGAHWVNDRTGVYTNMILYDRMAVARGRVGTVTAIVEYHPDYKEPCSCGCGYNTDRSHKRILPRAIPRSFTK
jgi:hypothetical protein